MNPEELKDLLSRVPFLPFRIFISDGQAFDVTERLSVAAGKNGLFIVLPDDRWKWITYRHIASVETLQAA